VIISVQRLNTFVATGGRGFDAKLPSLVFLHGAGMDHTVWALQARYFAHHGRNVLAVDLPGHGRSEGAPRRSIADWTRWTVAFLDAAGIERAALVGHSMGALIALETAAVSPARARSLALLGVAEKMPVHADLQTAASENRRLAPELIASWGHGRAGHFGGHPAPGLWMMGGSVAVLDRAEPGVLATDLAACDAYAGALDAARRISCPALFLLGAADRMTPPRAARPLIEAIAGADTVILPDAGHMMMAERPDAVTDALRDIV
jgi:pimeloyl-ACP methyl ester carboxylesterase